MEEEMKRIALTGDIDAFYGVIEREPGILKRIEKKDFVENPLHVAASVGHTDLAVEILSLKPSFGKKLNPSGYSPLDMALRNGHRETVKQLIKFDAGLIRVRSRERKTPLHYVAETDDADLVAEFLVACPTAIKELTIRGETAVHLTVLRGSLNAFRVLMGWMSRTDNNRILGWKDNKGNTVLHIAAQTRQLEVIRRLLMGKLVDLNDKNQENQTALEIVSNRIIISNSTSALPTVPPVNEDDVEIQKSLQQAGAWECSKLPNLMSMADTLTSRNYINQRADARNHVDWDKGMTGDVRNAFLVVTVLILTTTLQAVFNPPGGGSHSKGRDISSNSPTLLAPPPMTGPNSNINSTTSINGEVSIDDEIRLKLVVSLHSLIFFISLIITYKLTVPKINRNITILNSYLTGLLCYLMVTYVVSGVLMVPLGFRLYTFLQLVIVFLVSLFIILMMEGRMRRLCPWTTKDIIMREYVYRMEQKVRQGKYVA